MANRRRIYLINPRFQLKISLYICLILLIASSIYPVIIYDLMNSFAAYIAQHEPAKSALLEGKKFDLITVLTLWQLGFLALTFIVTIFFSHKIAGPLFKLQKFFRTVRDGGTREKLFFRKGDYFTDIAEDFNETFDSLAKTFKDDIEYLEEIKAYLNNLSISVPEDKKAVLAEIEQKISQIQGHYRNI